MLAAAVAASVVELVAVVKGTLSFCVKLRENFGGPSLREAAPLGGQVQTIFGRYDWVSGKGTSRKSAKR